MKVISKYIFIITISMSNFILAQIVKTDSTKNSGLVWGEDYAFLITAPDGWVIDNESGKPNGLKAVFYPVGGSWKKSISVMYANTISKKENGKETIERIIANDTLDFKNGYPRTKIYYENDILTHDMKKARVLCFYYSNYEAVAYIDEPKSVSMLVLTSRTEKDFKEAIIAFKKLVGSYYFLTQKVKKEKY